MQQFAYLCELALKISFAPQTPHRGFAPGPHWGLPPPDPRHLLPPENISGYATAWYILGDANNNLLLKNFKVINLFYYAGNALP